MNTYHIHIGGLVQGVGFRPFVCRVAATMGLHGWVSNGNDGVHAEVNATKETAEIFYRVLLDEAPSNAIICSHSLQQVTPKNFDEFVISESDPTAMPNLLLTPDIAICHRCKNEINNPEDKRYQYPFTTCVDCGPRYSIMQSLPYDRVNTSMAPLAMCAGCDEEYHDIHHRRHYSQTNSCNDCSIPVHLYDHNGVEIGTEFNSILVMVQKALQDGQIVAVKGIGGYLLLCDAGNAMAIETLRHRKQRPTKPFAVMYPSVAMIAADLLVSSKEKAALERKTAPVVLCKLKEQPSTGICVDVIANGLDKIGAMLPYSPLLYLIMQQWDKPLIATSGNLSGAPIVYTDEDALLLLTAYADFIVSFDRDILTPQDDSVMQFTQLHQQQIILRRSRGMAPNYYPSPFRQHNNVLAMGAELKSAFAVMAQHNVYVSQFLGDQGNYEAQVSYQQTLAHLLNILKTTPGRILTDAHPNYFVSQKGNELHQNLDVPVTAIQHHEAHFAAVLAENNLLHSNEPILGVVWDGTGYGDDEQIWGGEFFLKEDGAIERYMHLDYFPQLLGDKMSKEPRISAVSLLRNNKDHLVMMGDLFSVAESEYYVKLLQQKQGLLTSSMGRLLDGIAAILKVQAFNTYEGEAAMKLEVLARSCCDDSFDYYPVPINKNRLEWRMMIDAMMRDIQHGVAPAYIAKKVFYSLAVLIRNVAIRSEAKKIAFSGGVFQNAFLVDCIIELLKDEFELFFHQQLSPNDECIGFGQIAVAELKDSNRIAFVDNCNNAQRQIRSNQLITDLK